MVVRNVCNAAHTFLAQFAFLYHPEDMLRMWEMMRQQEETDQEERNKADLAQRQRPATPAGNCDRA